MAFFEYQHLMQKGSYLLTESEIIKLSADLLKCYCGLPEGISNKGLDKTKTLEARV